MDTVGTEVGQALRTPTVLLPDFRRVPPGTDGAVSVGGTLAGLLAALLLAALGSATRSSTRRRPRRRRRGLRRHRRREPPRARRRAVARHERPRPELLQHPRRRRPRRPPRLKDRGPALSGVAVYASTLCGPPRDGGCGLRRRKSRETQPNHPVDSSGGRGRGGASHGRLLRAADPLPSSLRPGGGPARTPRFARQTARGPDPRPVLANSSGSPAVLGGGSRDAPPLPRPASFEVRGEGRGRPSRQAIGRSGYALHSAGPLSGSQSSTIGEIKT